MIKIFILLIISFNILATEYSFVIKKGDSLSHYFQRIGLSDSLLINLVNSSKNTKMLNNLHIGNKLNIIVDNKSKFKSLDYHINNKKLVVTLNNNEFFSDIVYKDSPNKVTKKQVIIKKNLSQAVKEAQLTFNHLRQILQATKNKINPKKLQKGDVFTVYLRQNIVVGVVFNNKQSFFLWDGVFYNNKGNLVYDMFLESPLQYIRISSGFTYSRLHPILKVNLPHRAIDYAAPKGTPIYAAADGIVSFKGAKGPLGNTIIIKHNYGYETLYAHLSKYSNTLYQGKKVKKGQVIGFVGSTGRSTGNHLHYELKHYGEYKNPLKHRPKFVYRLRGRELDNFVKFVNALPR